MDSYLPHVLVHHTYHRSEDCRRHRNVPIDDRDHIGSPDNDEQCVQELSGDRRDKCRVGIPCHNDQDLSNCSSGWWGRMEQNTREVEEVIHCPLVIWIQMTSSLATVEGIGEAGHEEI